MVETVTAAGGKEIAKVMMTVTTLQTVTTMLSVMLMPALFFCLLPVLVIATMARMRAGMEQVRQMR